MPRVAAPALAEAWVDCLKRTLKLTRHTYKGCKRDYLFVMDGSRREFGPVLLSESFHERRADLAVQLPDIHVDSLPPAFVVARRPRLIRSNLVYVILAASSLSP